QEGDSGTGTLEFVLTLDLPAKGSEVVRYSTSVPGSGTVATPGVDYDAIAPADDQTVAFVAGATTASVFVTIQGDTDVEGDETLQLDLDQPVSVNVGQASGTGTIENDDAYPTVTIDQAAAQDDPTNASPVL